MTGCSAPTYSCDCETNVYYLLTNYNESFFRERQIKEIEASFEACKSRPVHATNKNLYAEEVLPLLPDFDRYVIFNVLFK